MAGTRRGAGENQANEPTERLMTLRKMEFKYDRPYWLIRVLCTVHQIPYAKVGRSRIYPPESVKRFEAALREFDRLDAQYFGASRAV